MLESKDRELRDKIVKVIIVLIAGIVILLVIRCVHPEQGRRRQIVDGDGGTEANSAPYSRHRRGATWTSCRSTMMIHVFPESS
ncbi:MAG: hypothetical protein V8Q42_03955 [Anaerovoracaceae bacterium]